MPILYTKEMREDIDTKKDTAYIREHLNMRGESTLQEGLAAGLSDKEFDYKKDTLIDAATKQLCDLCKRPYSDGMDIHMLQEMMQMVHIGDKSFQSSCGYEITDANTQLAVVDLLGRVQKGTGMTEESLTSGDMVTVKGKDGVFEAVTPPPAKKPQEPSRWMKFAHFFGGYAEEFKVYGQEKKEFDNFTAINAAAGKKAQSLTERAAQIERQRQEEEKEAAAKERVKESTAPWREERVRLHEIAMDQKAKEMDVLAEDNKYFSIIQPLPREDGNPLTDADISEARASFFHESQSLTTLPRIASRTSMGHIMMLSKGFTLDQIMSDDPFINEQKKAAGLELSVMFRKDDRKAMLEVFRLAGNQFAKEKLPDIDYADPAAVTANSARLSLMGTLSKDFFQISDPIRKEYLETYGKKDYDEKFDAMGWITHFADSGARVAKHFQDTDYVEQNLDGMGYSSGLIEAASGLSTVGEFGDQVRGKAIGDIKIDALGVAESAMKSMQATAMASGDYEKVALMVDYLRDGHNSPIHYSKGSVIVLEVDVTKDPQADNRRELFKAGRDVLAGYREGISRDSELFFGEAGGSFSPSNYSGLTTLDRNTSRTNFARLYTLATTDMTMDELMSDTPESNAKKVEAGKAFEALFSTHYKDVKEVTAEGVERTVRVVDEAHYNEKIVPVLSKMHAKLAELKPEEVDFKSPQQMREHAPKALVQGYFSMDLGQALSGKMKDDVAAFNVGSTDKQAVAQERAKFTVVSLAATQLRGITEDVCKLYASNSFKQGSFDQHDDSTDAGSFKVVSKGAAALHFSQEDTFKRLVGAEHFSDITPQEKDYLMLHTEESRANISNVSGDRESEPEHYDQELKKTQDRLDYMLGKKEEDPFIQSEKRPLIQEAAEASHVVKPAVVKVEQVQERQETERQETEKQQTEKQETVKPQSVRVSFSDLLEEESPAKARQATKAVPTMSREQERKL